MDRRKALKTMAAAASGGIVAGAAGGAAAEPAVAALPESTTMYYQVYDFHTGKAISDPIAFTPDIGRWRHVTQEQLSVGSIGVSCRVPQ